MYDTNNIFARILRNEIPAAVVAEGDHFLAFKDLYPKADIHVLVIPRGAYITAHDFFENAPHDEIIGFHKGISDTVQLLGIKDSGYQLHANAGVGGGQEVPHYHVHILAHNKK